MPRTVRVLWEFDKAGAEWVVVAYAAGDAQMIKVCENPRLSPHVHTGSLISGAPYDLIEKEDAICGKITDPVELEERRRDQLPELLNGAYFVPRIFTIRQAGKKSNHGLNYGMQYRRFALENEMDESDAKKICEGYSQKASPNLPVWWDGIKTSLRKDRTLINCFGRKRRFLDQWGPDLFMEAYAFIPQSTIVDIFNLGIPRIYDERSKPFRSIKIKNQVHDSLVVQTDIRCDRGGYREAAAAAHKIAHHYLNPLLEYGGRQFRIRTDMKMGTHLGDGLHKVGLTDDEDQTARAIENTIGEILSERQQAA